MSEGKKPQKLSAEWRQRIALYGGILLILLIAAFIPRVYNTSKSVELAKPGEGVAYVSQAALGAEVAGFAMDDPAWKDEPIGNTGFTLGEAGSLVCQLAFDAGGDPATVNRLLNEQSAYTDTGGIYWERVNAALAPLAYTYHEKPDPALAIDSMAEGRSVLVKVADAKNNALWLYLLDIADGAYRVYDPQADAARPLSNYGRVYGILVGQTVN